MHDQGERASMGTQAGKVTTGQIDEATLLYRIEALVPELRERAGGTEDLRQIPQRTIDDMWATGYLSAFRTRHFGGPGLGLSALANGARILAHGCASTAWTMVFLAQATWMFAKANLELQEELLGGERPGMQAGAIGRLGVAVPVPGGYQVTVRSDWNSGVMHADWVNCEALIEGDEQVMMVVMPTADVVIEDVWHTAGLRGTGSNTIVVDDLFVPAHRVQPALEFLGTRRIRCTTASPGPATRSCPSPCAPSRRSHSARPRPRWMSFAVSSSAAPWPFRAAPSRPTSPSRSSGSARR